MLDESIASQLDVVCTCDLKRQARNTCHKWFLEPIERKAPYNDGIGWEQLLRLPWVMRTVLAERMLWCKGAYAGQIDLTDCHGYAPGIYQLDAKSLKALSRVFHFTLPNKLWSSSDEVRHCVEDAESGAYCCATCRQPLESIHGTSPDEPTTGKAYVGNKGITKSPARDKELIRALGGPAAVARLIGLNPSNGGTQRVQNWTYRGIPSAIRLQHMDVFGKPEGQEARDVA